MIFFAGCVTAPTTNCKSGDCIDGVGVFTWADGSQYSGGWRNGLKNGKGTYSSPDGSYNGSWKNNKRDGYGTQLNQDGEKYAGGWSKDLKHGKGTNTFPNHNPPSVFPAR